MILDKIASVARPVVTWGVACPCRGPPDPPGPQARGGGVGLHQRLVAQRPLQAEGVHRHPAPAREPQGGLLAHALGPQRPDGRPPLQGGPQPLPHVLALIRSGGQLNAILLRCLLFCEKKIIAWNAN